MRDRLQAEKSKVLLLTFSNIIFCASFLILLVAFSSWNLESLVSSFNLMSTSNHPTSIPWLSGKSECEHTGRVWRDSKCWDYEHNMMF